MRSRKITARGAAPLRRSVARRELERFLVGNLRPSAAVGRLHRA